VTTAAGPTGGRRAQGPSADDRPAKVSGNAARAAAQRASTVEALAQHSSFLDRFAGPIVEEPPAWRPIVALILSVLGLGVSIYLTVDHFAHIALACSDNGLVNCQKVTTSAQSHFLGIPVAVLGLAFFVAMTVMNLPFAWRIEDRRIHIVRLAMVVIGMCFVLYLVAAELLIIKNICLWCTSVHALTFLLFVLMLVTVPPMVGWSGPGAATD